MTKQSVNVEKSFAAKFDSGIKMIAWKQTSFASAIFHDIPEANNQEIYPSFKNEAFEEEAELPIFVLLFANANNFAFENAQIAFHLALKSVQNLMIRIGQQVLMDGNGSFVLDIHHIHNDINVRNRHQTSEKTKNFVTTKCFIKQ